MQRLCDEILQIILNELDDPSAFSLISKRYYTFTQDPYVRALYFLSRYGPIQAMYWALGRGRLMNEKVIDILLSSGAHLSRYLVQCAMHHYYRTAQVPFIKTPWVRSMNLMVFTHFQAAAVQLYGNIPLGKGDDDASLFETLIKESRFPSDSRSITWDTLKDVLEKYKFMPFCNKDVMMANFPLALSIEPSLLPFARANGFLMDHKYRDFVFRKMFEKPAIAFETRADEIVRNVQELARLDPRMFLSRTVAAEICMEVKTNEAAYNALRRLDKDGMLKFELSSVVVTLIKTYANTRSIGTRSNYDTLRQLYMDFKSNDRVVRQVLLLQVFINQASSTAPQLQPAVQVSIKTYAETCKQQIESIGLAPVERTDLLEVLSNRFAPDRFEGIIEYARTVLTMSRYDIETLVQEVAFRCLQNGCKGKMLKALVDSYPFLEDAIRLRVVKKYKLNLDDLPPHQDEAACNAYEAPLCQDYLTSPRYRYGPELPNPSKTVTFSPGGSSGDSIPDSEADRQDVEAVERALRTTTSDEEDEDLGAIGQDTLSSMIRKDELAPARSRRRFYYETYNNFNDSQGKLPYPSDNTPVGEWVRKHYGPRSAVTAVFMLHAVINGSPQTIQPYLLPSEVFIAANRVPPTFKHFKILARLGRAPHPYFFDDIEAGAEFYFSEEDYLSFDELEGASPKITGRMLYARMRAMMTAYPVKTESSPAPSANSRVELARLRLPDPSFRPRRGAASSAKNYVVPDSDDDMIADHDEDEIMQQAHVIAKNRRDESNLQKWIKHLSELLKEEQKKYNEKKKMIQASVNPSTKVKVPKSAFHRSLALQLVRLRKVDKGKRHQLYGLDCPDQDYSSGEEDEYHDRNPRPVKRRKIQAMP